MAYQCWVLCWSVLPGVALSDSPTSLRGAVQVDEACRLAVAGEECYEAVEWAMEHGIRQHPEWYPDLTPESPTEAFQDHLYRTGHGNCPQPCSVPSTTEPPVEACRRAVQGDECYAHVEWAMQHGITLNPESYPGLTPTSTFEDFQTFLHNLDHGSCPMPCRSPQPPPVPQPTPQPTPPPTPQPTPQPTKKQCCGKSGCYSHNREYDPETEQCCGEGEYIYSPTVCSKDSGCCLSGYSAYPKCFDYASQQCCGQNYASEMPVVCNLDVACPSESASWRQCPSALGAAATAANSSSNAETGSRLFIP